MSNNSSNLTDLLDTNCVYEDDPYATAKLFNFCLTLFIAFCGLCGNVMVVVVNGKITKQTSTNVYLTFLAISDNLVIVTLSLYAYRYVYQIVFPHVSDWRSSGYATLSGILVERFAQCLNTYIIVLLNVDRYLQVKHILRAKVWCTPKRALCNVLIVAIAAILFWLPRIWEYVPLLLNTDVSVEKCYGYFSGTHGIGNEKMYQLIYIYILYSLVMYVIPLITLTFTSYTLISTICRRIKWLNSIKAKGSRDREGYKRSDLNAIITLVIVTLTFMALQIPDITAQVIWRVAASYGPTASIFTYQLMILNSSVNFLIYSVASTVFRARLIQILKGCCQAQSAAESWAGSSDVIGRPGKMGELSHEDKSVGTTTDTSVTIECQHIE